MSYLTSEFFYRLKLMDIVSFGLEIALRTVRPNCSQSRDQFSQPEMRFSCNSFLCCVQPQKLHALEERIARKFSFLVEKTGHSICWTSFRFCNFTFVIIKNFWKYISKYFILTIWLYGYYVNVEEKIYSLIFLSMLYGKNLRYECSTFNQYLKINIPYWVGQTCFIHILKT